MDGEQASVDYMTLQAWGTNTVVHTDVSRGLHQADMTTSIQEHAVGAVLPGIETAVFLPNWIRQQLGKQSGKISSGRDKNVAFQKGRKNPFGIQTFSWPRTACKIFQVV